MVEFNPTSTLDTSQIQDARRKTRHNGIAGSSPTYDLMLWLKEKQLLSDNGHKPIPPVGDQMMQTPGSSPGGTNDGVMKALMGIQNANSMRAMFSRGKNVYPGGSNAAQSGPGGLQMGRPSNNAVRRRIQMMNSGRTDNSGYQAPWG
jgi:hypothetical protein